MRKFRKTPRGRFMGAYYNRRYYTRHKEKWIAYNATRMNKPGMREHLLYYWRSRARALKIESTYHAYALAL